MKSSYALWYAAGTMCPVFVFSHQACVKHTLTAAKFFGENNNSTFPFHLPADGLNLTHQKEKKKKKGKIIFQLRWNYNDCWFHIKKITGLRFVMSLQWWIKLCMGELEVLPVHLGSLYFLSDLFKSANSHMKNNSNGWQLLFLLY